VSRLAGWGVLVAGLTVSATIAFPSIQPVDIIAGLGVFSIAAGFAFQDILSNLLAGLLLIFRQPFVGGDQIEVSGWEGTVEEITIRETAIRTYDGQRVIIPNADVYQSAVRIQTAFPQRRTSLIVGVSYEADLDEACAVALAALEETDGVLADPAPDALLSEFGDSAVVIDVRFWSAPDQAAHLQVLHRAVRGVKRALDEAGIEIPFPMRTLVVRSGSGAPQSVLQS
jgi:small-conductance mechanosensitive channel